MQSQDQQNKQVGLDGPEEEFTAWDKKCLQRKVFKVLCKIRLFFFSMFGEFVKQNTQFHTLIARNQRNQKRNKNI